MLIKKKKKKQFWVAHTIDNRADPRGKVLPHVRARISYHERPHHAESSHSTCY